MTKAVRRARGWGLAALLASTCVGCASTNPQPSVDRVDAEVKARTGRRVYWNQGKEEDEAVRVSVDKMLRDGLTEEEAVQVALINNHALQATYEELGVAQAELVQAGLLKNPTFRASYRVGDKESPLPDWTLGVEQDFLSLVLMPAKKQIANAQQSLAEARVTNAVLRVAHDVRVAYVSAVAADQELALEQAIVDGAQITADLSQRQLEAGTASDFDSANQVAQYEDMRLDLGRTQVQVVVKREELNRLLGLWGTSVAWRAAGMLSPLPSAEPPLEHLEARAIERRTDVAVARREAELARRTLGVARTFRFFGGAGLGLTVDRHSSTGTGPKEWSLEPGASIEVPIFDQRQATVARLEAELRQSEHRLTAVAVDARSDVRVARASLLAARATVDHYQRVLVPLRERLVALAQQQYNSMLIGVYQLLQAKGGERAAYRGYIQAVRDYWIARADLELAIGDRLPRTTVAPSPAAPPSATSAVSSSGAPTAPSSPASGASSSAAPAAPAPAPNHHH